MNSIAKPSPHHEITDFGQWCKLHFRNNWIEVTGDEESGYELRTPPELLDAAWHWLAIRYDRKSGSECLDFLADEILDEHTDKYAGKLLVSIIDAIDPVFALNKARELRHHYAARKIEYFKDDLVRLTAQSEEGPIEAFKRKRDEDDGVSIHG